MSSERELFVQILLRSAEKRKKELGQPKGGMEDGTPPPHRDFKERGVVR